MSTPIGDAAEELQSALGKWDPQNVADFRALFRDLPQLIENLSEGLQSVGSKMADETPLHPDVAEHLQEMIPVLGGLHEHAESLSTLFENRHERELDRIDNPRTGEEMFDVSQQD